MSAPENTSALWPIITIESVAIAYPRSEFADPVLPGEPDGRVVVDFGVNPTREQLEAAGFSFDSPEYRRDLALFKVSR